MLLPVDAFMRDYWRFDGWDTNADGDGERYAADQTLREDLADRQGMPVRMFAQWVSTVDLPPSYREQGKDFRRHAGAGACGRGLRAERGAGGALVEVYTDPDEDASHLAIWPQHSDAGGLVRVFGLRPGTCSFANTEVSAGYQVSEDGYEIVIAEDGTEIVTGRDCNVSDGAIHTGLVFSGEPIPPGTGGLTRRAVEAVGMLAALVSVVALVCHLWPSHRHL